MDLRSPSAFPATPLHFTSIGRAFCVHRTQSGLQVIDPFHKLAQMQAGSAEAIVSKLFADNHSTNELFPRYKSMSAFHQRISVSMSFTLFPTIFSTLRFQRPAIYGIFIATTDRKHIRWSMGPPVRYHGIFN